MTEETTFPIEITFRDIAPSAAVERRIRKEAGKLQRFHQRIMRCRIVVAVPERHQHKGRIYAVRINIAAPDGALWINRASSYNPAHADIYVAIRDAFAAATRRLEAQVSRKAGKHVKRNRTPPHGVVSRVFPDKGYGFIQTPDEREIYFNDSSVVNGGFKRLGSGSEVRFVLAPDDGPEGPQASTVKLIGKHHLVG